MSRDACSRTWEADALVDRRLGDADRASFERHQRGCAPCHRRVAVLEELAATMAELPDAASSPLARHRARAALLREANRRWVELAPRGRRGLVFAAALGSVAIAAAAALIARPAPAPPIRAVREQIEPLRPRALEGSLDVESAWPTIDVPDEDGEGAAEPREGARRDTGGGGHPAEASRSGAHFVRAMAAFEAGDYAHADALFASFGRAYPGDSRAEDAAFLRAMAHERMGDPEGASALAAAYLDRFPRGLRATEARRWLDAGHRW